MGFCIIQIQTHIYIGWEKECNGGYLETWWQCPLIVHAGICWYSCVGHNILLLLYTLTFCFCSMNGWDRFLIASDNTLSRRPGSTTHRNLINLRRAHISRVCVWLYCKPLLTDLHFKLNIINATVSSFQYDTFILRPPAWLIITIYILVTSTYLFIYICIHLNRSVTGNVIWLTVDTHPARYSVATTYKFDSPNISVSPPGRGSITKKKIHKKSMIF